MSRESLLEREDDARLFRSDALSSRSAKWLGSVRLVQSVPFWYIALVAFILAVALVIYGIFGTYTKKARITGLLVAQGGEINVATPVTGRVVETRVREGQAVGAGAVLFVLDTDRTTEIAGSTGNTSELVAQHIAARRSALIAERRLRENQARMRREAMSDRLVTLDAELCKFDDEMVLQVRRRDLAAQSVRRYEKLTAAGFVSSIQAQQQQEALIDQDARLQALNRMKLGLERDRQTLVAEQQQIGVQLSTELVAVDRELASINQEATENAARRSTLVVAPHTGRVTAISIGTGQFVSAGQSLAAVQPEGAPLEAHLFAPSRTVGFVKEHQPVLVRYAAYPYQKFGLYSGKVASVSKSAFAPNELTPAFQTLFGRPANPEGLYRVIVVLDKQHVDAYGQSQPLKPGMALDADLVQDRRRIVEWMLEPLFAFARRT